ncbi:uncharacterized protein LACBIDRAFT_324432 [Laccaria bicolor S238N-H82]|uniref:Predicted protein n=1 Tax=Laccaria bicolor (strain S238N-H82 / ATCC MYA-4686) TaxID=486041 RepID=B0D1T1_LACBS|nr:uncharacterized protein LACBIDRAFT_324432 [Laccaria bicolor S238N-H82]EDR11696.1 predicted protein [Laccaria bicolor S238N-H82]|eukprot:XP_001877593.1 predicted protein [Laccaria bicolor S238N-H82]
MSLSSFQVLLESMLKFYLQPYDASEDKLSRSHLFLLNVAMFVGEPAGAPGYLGPFPDQVQPAVEIIVEGYLPHNQFIAMNALKEAIFIKGHTKDDEGGSSSLQTSQLRTNEFTLPTFRPSTDKNASSQSIVYQIQLPATVIDHHQGIRRVSCRIFLAIPRRPKISISTQAPTESYRVLVPIGL